MKAKLILKSLADLPTNAWLRAASMPRRTLNFSRQLLAAPTQSARRQLADARSHSSAVMQDMYRRINTPFRRMPA